MRRRTKSHRGRNIAAVVGAIIIVVAVGVALNFSGSNIRSSDPSLLTVTAGMPVLGSKAAPVTIFGFEDFQCPSCGYWVRTQEHTIIQNLVDTGKAKIIWRDFDYYGQDSTYASEAAYAAGEQGKFWQFYDILYSNQGTPNSGWAGRTNLIAFAQQLGLNMTEFNQSFNSGRYLPLINSNFQAGQSLGVQGTPTFFVVGPTGKVVNIVGGQPASVFEQTVDSLVTGG